MKRKRTTLMIVFVGLMLVIVAAWAGEEQLLINDDILKPAKLSIGDDVIISKIKTRQGREIRCVGR